MRRPHSGTFRKGKETLKKKAKELSTLCGIPVCAVIVGPRGKAETWPESRSDVKTVFDVYKKKIQNLDHRRHDTSTYYKTDAQFSEIDDDDHDEIMECLNSKIRAIERRIIFLQKMNEIKIEKEAGC